MNTFKYKNGNIELSIAVMNPCGDIRLIIDEGGFFAGITLDQEGLDALRNYLDDLEMEE